MRPFAWCVLLLAGFSGQVRHSALETPRGHPYFWERAGASEDDFERELGLLPKAKAGARPVILSDAARKRDDGAQPRLHAADRDGAGRLED